MVSNRPDTTNERPGSIHLGALLAEKATDAIQIPILPRTRRICIATVPDRTTSSARAPFENATSMFSERSGCLCGGRLEDLRAVLGGAGVRCAAMFTNVAIDHAGPTAVGTGDTRRPLLQRQH